MNNIAGLGHNNPPTDQEIIAEKLFENNQEIIESSEKLIKALERAPSEVTNEEEAGKVANYIKQITSGMKKLDKAKREVSRRLTDFQRKERERLEREQREEAARLKAEADRKAEEAAAAEAEGKVIHSGEAMQGALNVEEHARHIEDNAAKTAQKESSVRGSEGSLASLKKTWKGEIISREEIDLESLRHHIPADALQKALNSFIRAGGRELKGAKIFEHYDSVVR